MRILPRFGSLHFNSQRGLLLLFSFARTLSASAAEPAITPERNAAAIAKVDRRAPPTVYSTPVDRYRFGAYGPGLVSSPAFYAIPQDAVTRDTYLRWIEEMNLFEVAETPNQGLGGPQRFMPVLVKYVQTGERRHGEAIIAMLKDWHRAMMAEVARKGWTEQFIEEPCFIPLYRKHLLAGGLMKEGDAWFRDLWLDYR